MITIRWKILGLNEPADSLCLTCTWGLVRRGFRVAEEETLCRLVSPNALVPFPVRDCSGYADHRTAETAAIRRIGFVTEANGEETIELLAPVADPTTK